MTPEPSPAAGSSADPDPPPAASAPPAHDPEMAELRRKAAERDQFQDKMLRALADYQNLAKRLDRERAETEFEKMRAAIAAFLAPLDDLGRVADAAEGGEAALRDGVAMVAKGFAKALKECGVDLFAAAGEPFNPQEHEAVGYASREGIAPGHILRVISPGYQFRGRILRPARVIVAQSAERKSEGKTDADVRV